MVFLIIAIGFFYALPNFYGEDPALQISGTHGVELDQKKIDSIKSVLDSRSLNKEPIYCNISARYAEHKSPLNATKEALN